MSIKKTYNFNSGLHTKKCKKCKAPILSDVQQDYCATCYKKIEDVFNKIRKYLEDYPGATAFEIEMELGIPSHVTNNFVRDGRLIEIPNDFINIDCKRCGCLLLSAHSKYCPPCRQELDGEMKRAVNQLTPLPSNERKGKMHTKFHVKDR